ncbi:hypothetical protein ACFVVB_19865 [Streptomyces californicus]|uniref:hypothetical protein n=1 Tax=Streptomyces californicus TaxID=67351 RepID=UPI0036DA2E50
MAGVWIFLPRIQHVIITRIHRVSSRHFEHLFALRELTKIRPTLLYRGPLSPALAASLLHEAVHTLAAARRAAARQPVRVVGWWWWGGELCLACLAGQRSRPRRATIYIDRETAQAKASR